MTDCQFIQDCLNGKHGRKHQAAAESAAPPDRCGVMY